MSAQTMVLAIKARMLFKNLGAKSAAGYLRNRGVTLEVAVKLLGLPERRFA